MTRSFIGRPQPDPLPPATIAARHEKGEVLLMCGVLILVALISYRRAPGITVFGMMGAAIILLLPSLFR